MSPASADHLGVPWTEEKIRIVLEGFRRELTVSDLCRREGIKPGAYYAWTKDYGMQSMPMKSPSPWRWCSTPP